MAPDSPHDRTTYALIAKAFTHAGAMPVCRQQCRLLCDIMQSALTTGLQGQSGIESAQQLDDTINVLLGNMVIWRRYDLIECFLNSRQILSDISKLFGELALCGLAVENLEGKKRDAENKDRADFLKVLYTIIRNDEDLNRLSKQSQERVRFLVNILQQTEAHSKSMDNLLPIQNALAYLYRNIIVDIPSPNLSMQITDIARVPTTVSITALDHRAKWLENEEVAVKSVRHLRGGEPIRSLFVKEVQKFYSLNHQNILRTFGYVVDDTLGCCLVTPWSSNWSVTKFLEKYNAPILPLLLDVATGLRFLHQQDPPIIHGCLCAESIYVDKDGNACLGDFGVANLIVRSTHSLGTMLRWCAPEIIQISSSSGLVDRFASVICERTDIYAFGMTMFRQSMQYLKNRTCANLRLCNLFPGDKRRTYTGVEPFHHIADEDTLSEEVMHGMRPSVSADLKLKATKRCLSNEVWSLMRTCWDGKPENRATLTDIIDELNVLWEASQPKRASVQSSVHNGGNSVGSGVHGKYSPQQQCRPHATTAKSSSIQGNGQPSPSSSAASDRLSYDRIFEDLTLNDSPSRSSFPDDSSDAESYIGQVFEQPMDYSKMPRVAVNKPTRKRSSAGDGKFRILVSHMTSAQQVHKEWAGVSKLEQMREHKGPSLRQDKMKEVLMEAEAKFFSPQPDIVKILGNILRQNPSIIGNEDVEAFLDNLFEERLALCFANTNFLNGLQATPSAADAEGLTKLGLLCKEAGMEFSSVYPDYVRHLPDIERTLNKKIEANIYFARKMQSTLETNGKTLYEYLMQFLRAPLTHLEKHPLYIKGIIKEMGESHPDYGLLMDAYKEMAKAVFHIHLVSWQMADNHSRRDWCDFVVPESLRTIPSSGRALQSAIFSLIVEEKDYVVRLKQMKDVIETWSHDAGPVLGAQMISFNVVCDDLLHFHRQLLENLTVVQRTQHPHVEAFVSMCGIPQIPWQSLYFKRYGTAFVNLRELVKGSRGGAVDRVHLEKLEEPVTHLQRFMEILRSIYLNTPSSDEDRVVLGDILPRLRAVSYRTTELILNSKDLVRLVRVACALDYSKFPSVEKDVNILLEGRILFGAATLGVERRLSKTSQFEEKYVVLLDNYLVFATVSQEHGTHHLVVSEKPIALELLTLLHDDTNGKTSSRYRLANKVPVVTFNYKTNQRVSISLYAESAESSKAWARNINEAMTRREQTVKHHQVIALQTLEQLVQEPVCTTEIVVNSRTYLVHAYDEGGIYIKSDREEPRIAVRLDGITAIVPLAEEEVLLVLANRSLRYYRFVDLLDRNESHQPSYSVSDQDSVQFFRVGVLQDHTVLFVLKEKKNVYTLQEYTIIERGKTFLPVRRKSKTTIFRLASEFQVPNSCSDVVFFKNIIYVVTRQGFYQLQIRKPGLKGIDEETPVLPQPNDVRLDIVQRSHQSKPISMHQFNDGYILCYSSFATYVTTHGALTSKVVHWSTDNPATSVVFRPPYLILFAETLIEVREIESGRLVQLWPVAGKLTWEKQSSRRDPGIRDTRDYKVHVVLPQSQQGIRSQGDTVQWYSLGGESTYMLCRMKAADGR